MTRSDQFALAVALLAILAVSVNGAEGMPAVLRNVFALIGGVACGWFAFKSWGDR